MCLIPHAASLAPLIGQRIHGWLAPLVDQPALDAIALAEARAQGKPTEEDLLERVLAKVAERSMTAKEVAKALGIGEKSAKNTLWRLGTLKQVEGEYARGERNRWCKIYPAIGT